MEDWSIRYNYFAVPYIFTKTVSPDHSSTCPPLIIESKICLPAFRRIHNLIIDRTESLSLRYIYSFMKYAYMYDMVSENIFNLIVFEKMLTTSYFIPKLWTEDGKTYQTVTIWIVTIWKHFIRWLISGMKIFQNLFGMKYIQMVTGKWYENYSDRTQIDLVWTSFIRWLVIGMKISYCHQMNCHHLKYPLNLTL